MPKSIMYYNKVGPKKIDFQVRIRGDCALQQIAFIYLVSARFGGAIKAHKDRSKFGDGRHYTSLSINFNEFEATSDAYAHCNGHLDENGCVERNYLGALDNADPHLRCSRELFRVATGREPVDL